MKKRQLVDEMKMRQLADEVKKGSQLTTETRTPAAIQRKNTRMHHPRAKNALTSDRISTPDTTSK